MLVIRSGYFMVSHHHQDLGLFWLLKIKMFSESQKKWIIQQFGRAPQPASTRRTFLTHFKIRRRATKAYQLNKFIRVHDHFHEFGSIKKQKRAKTNPKRTEEVVENVKSFVQENPGTLLSPQEIFTASFLH